MLALIEGRRVGLGACVTAPVVAPVAPWCLPSGMTRPPDDDADPASVRDGLCRLHHEACSSTARRGAARAQTPCALSLEIELLEHVGRAAAELARAQAASGTGRRRAAATAERSSEKDHPAPPRPVRLPVPSARPPPPSLTPRRETGDGRRAAADGAEPQTAPAGRQLL